VSLLSLQVPEARATHQPLSASILSANTDFMAQSPDWRASASCHHTKTGSIACLCHFGTRKSVDVAFFHSFTAQLTDITQIALLEWSASLHDLITVSIHTYERAPQLVSVRRTSPEVSPSFPWSSSPSTRPYSGPSSGRIPYLGVPHYLSRRMPLPCCPSTNRKWISTS
jgi:hypothetical protein